MSQRHRPSLSGLASFPAGGPTIYLGRDMKMSHKGMGITKADYAAFMHCLSATLDTFEVAEPERSKVVAFAPSLEPDIVEAQ
jgi:hemoglobin